MAIQRAAAGPLSGNPAASAILGGANLAGGGCSCGGTCEECKKKPVQRKAAPETATPHSGFHAAINRSGPGTSLPSHTRGAMEHRFGHSFEDVRIHDDGAAADAARAIQAHAFTMGRDVYFGRGRYQPHTTTGQKLLAHELTHVLQQRSGAVPPAPKSLFASHDDIFEREAEQAEMHIERGAHGISSALPRQHYGSHHEPPRSNALQRKCACGGTCAKCSSQDENTKKAPVQRKSEGTLTRFEGNVQPGGETIQRKCACDGTCSKCSAATSGPSVVESRKSGVPHPVEDIRSLDEKPGSSKHEHGSGPTIQRKAETAVQTSREKPSVSRDAKSASSVRRGDAETGKNSVSRPHAASGVARRETRALHTGYHPATAPVQRQASYIGRPGPATRDSALEHEASATASEIAQGREIPAEKFSSAEYGSVQALDWEWCNPFTDPDCGISSTAGVVAGEAEEIASDVWDKAKDLASAVGGFLKYVNNLLTITIPPKHILNAHSFQLELAELGIDLPFLAGAVPIAPGVEVYGELGLHLGIIPEIGLQLGPIDTHEIVIALHPLTLDGEVTGGFDLTIAGLLGGEARAGIFGEVGVVIAWPDPPFVLTVPLANIQAGLAGTLRGIIGDHMTVDFHAEAGITGFSFDLNQAHNLVAAIDMGLAGYGLLSVLETDLCSLRWPLLEAHEDTAITLGLDFGLSSLFSGGIGGGDSGFVGGGGDFGGGGSSDSFDIAHAMGGRDSGFVGGGGTTAGGGAGGSWGDDLRDTSPPLISPRMPQATLGPKDWSGLGLKFQRGMRKDDCPLCDFLRDLGLMPSQMGGPWPFHPTPPLTVGPLANVYSRNPHIPSGALCRGACGSDCKTCQHELEHRECEETPDGHFWWIYPNYEDCGTHLGCRNHDACYDWCADKHNEKGKLGIILGPCHRLCDFECICDYNLPQCVGWIGGGKPHDGRMLFSDPPRKVPGCKGPCPHKVTHKGGAESWLVCLPTLELFPRKNVAAKHLHEETKKYTIWRKDAWIPYVGLATVEIYASGNLDGSLSAGLGPGTMNNICFDYNPHTGKYKARGDVRIPADFLAALTASAKLGADARWFLIVKVASATGTLEAKGKLAGKGALILSGEVDISCTDGKPTLESDLNFHRCLELAFDLTAGFDIEAVGFTVFSRKWSLLSAKWDKCWGEDVTVTHAPKDPKIDLRDQTIKLTDLLEWLLSDKAEKTEPADKQRQIKESPLTAATARTVSDLAPQLDRTNQSSSPLTLRSGASNNAGTDMMTRFLTEQHSPGSEDTSKAQKNIYGFGKLPTRGAGAGNGFSAKEYIKGHLLNGKLGGLAEDKNLFPITAAANHDHSSDVEDKVKGLVKDQKLVAMYGVRVSGQDGPHDIDVFGDRSCTYEYLNANFECTYGTYTLFTDNTVELQAATDKTIRSTFDLGGFISDVKAKNCPQK